MKAAFDSLNVEMHSLLGDMSAVEIPDPICIGWQLHVSLFSNDTVHRSLCTIHYLLFYSFPLLNALQVWLVFWANGTKHNKGWTFLLMKEAHNKKQYSN